MKEEPGEEDREKPRGRFAKRRADQPEAATKDASKDTMTPGPRNPDPLPPTNADGYVTVPSEDEVSGKALDADPQPPAAAPLPKPRRNKDAAGV